MDLKVGKKLYWVPNRGEPSEVEITKIGYKWVTLNYPSWRPYRISRNDFTADGYGYSSPGKCYESKEAFDEMTYRDNIWCDTIKRIHQYRAPSEMTTKEIEDLRKKLGLSTEEKITEKA